MVTVSDVWSAVASLGKKIHRLPNCDGRRTWNEIKPQLMRVEGVGKWSAGFLQVYDLRGSLKDAEDEHFLRQHFKIPGECECEFVRLMQVIDSTVSFLKSTMNPFFTRLWCRSRTTLGSSSAVEHASVSQRNIYRLQHV